MKDFPIPVLSVGPGSQNEDEAVDFIGSPGEMNAFAPPRMTLAADTASHAEALAFLDALCTRMAATRFGAPLSMDLAALPAPVRAVVNEALGQGEVSATVAGAVPLRIQETVFAGLWRVLGEDATDRLEAAPMPAAVPLTAQMTGFSQSMIDATRRWAPRLMLRPTSPSTLSGASAGPGLTGITDTRRSAPVQKCRSPAAVMTTHRMLRSFDAPSMREMVRLRWSGVMALAASGRLRVRVATPLSAISKRMSVPRIPLGSIA